MNEIVNLGFFEVFNQLPFYLNFIFIFILGSIIGSFLNVVILREENGKSLDGRSACPKCQTQIKWYDLVPILSWIILLGKCRKCHSRISVQYPLVEAATAILFTAIYSQSFNSGLFSWQTLGFTIWHGIMFSLLICMFVFDLYHKIIPDKWSFTFAGLALIQTIYLLSTKISWVEIINLDISNLAWFNAFAGIILFIPFWAIWFFSGGRAMGLGDGKLALGIGWYLGFVYGLSAVILGFWIGAFFAILLLIRERINLFKGRLNKDHKNITMKTEVPFGPFLIAGILIEFFWALDVIGVGLFF
jgi:leader peptidase (prepilin peptidase)/N-methyltransferase